MSSITDAELKQFVDTPKQIQARTDTKKAELMETGLFEYSSAFIMHLKDSWFFYDTLKRQWCCGGEYGDLSKALTFEYVLDNVSDNLKEKLLFQLDVVS